MLNLLGKSLLDYLSNGLVIVGLVLLALGIATIILSKRITRVARQQDDVDEKDKIYIATKIIGIVVMAIGFVMLGLYVIFYIIGK